MSLIKPLKILADSTHGDQYFTQRFCYDEFQHPDSEIDVDQKYIFKNYGECIRHEKPINLQHFISRVTEPLFSFFMDGSRRTYKIGDIGYKHRIYPIFIGQIGVACSHRLSPSKMQVERIENRLIIAVPSSANAEGDPVNDKFCQDICEKINNESSLMRHNIKISKVITYPEKADIDYSNLAISSLHEEMLDMEKEFVNWLTRDKRLLEPSKRLIKDGSVEYQRSKRGNYGDISRLRSNYQYVVGVSKKFNPEKCVDIKGKPKASDLAKLPLFYRTPAFKFRSTRASGEDGEIYISAWYVRIRDIKYTESPFDGIVKIERILVSDAEIDNGLDSEEVDAISANIILERNPTCFGNDTRWANHLYPIYLTECCLKYKRLSDAIILNIL